MPHSSALHCWHAVVQPAVAIIRFLQQRLSRTRSRAARRCGGWRGPRKSLAAEGLRVLPPPRLRALHALHDGGLRVVASVCATRAMAMD